MSWTDLRRALRRYWPVGLVALLAVEAVGAVAAFVPDKKYEATATVLVQPRSTRTFDFNAASAIEFLAPVMVRQVKTGTFPAAVRDRLPRDMRAEPIDVEASHETGTGIVSVTATSERPAAAAAIANAAAEVLIKRRVSRVIRLSLLDGARVPTKASSPQPLPIFAGSTVIGVFVALMLVVIAAAYRRRLSDAEAVGRVADVLVIGEIPKRRRLPLPGRRRLPAVPAEAFHKAPEIREAYRKLAARILIASRAWPADAGGPGRPSQAAPHDPMALGVTSWSASEGKTTVTANVAWALALNGQPTLAVDADLRRPALHEAFGVSNARGLADIARGGDVGAVACSTDLASLLVIPSGMPSEHPVDVVSAALPHVFEESSDAIVLVDSPPVMQAESTVIATAVQAIILVVDGRRAKPDHLERALRELELAGARVLGVVVNRARVRRQRKSAYGYSDGLPRTAARPDDSVAAVSSIRIPPRG